MANIVYSLSAKKDKRTGKQEILVRLYHGRINQRGKTGIFGRSEYWDNDKQHFIIPKVRVVTPEKKELLSELQSLNTEIESLSTFLTDAFIQAGAGSIELPNKWVSSMIMERRKAGLERVKEEEAANSPFFVVFEEYINTQDCSLPRKRHFWVLYRSLRRYALYNDLDLSFSSLTSARLRDFETFLKDEHTLIGKNEEGKTYFRDLKYEKAFKAVPESRLPQPRGKNMLIDTMSRFRTFLRWAMKRGYLDKNPFDDYTIGMPVYGTPFYLTKEERNRLLAAEFPDNPGLDVQRDTFVLQCFIGCRVGDYMRMTKNNIIDGAIEYVPRKTKEGHPVTVRVPLSPTAQQILARYPKCKGNKLMPFICEQDYNRDIKKMLRLAGIDRVVTTLNPLTREEEKHPIWEVASSHMARRVLVGNLYHEVKDPNLIAKISGHVENSRAFARYRGIDEEMAKELILKLE